MDSSQSKGGCHIGDQPDIPVQRAVKTAGRSRSDGSSFGFGNHDEQCECGGPWEDLPEELQVTWTALLYTFATGIGAYTFDVGSDIYNAVYHLINGDYWYSGLTLLFAVISTLVIAFYDYKNRKWNSRFNKTIEVRSLSSLIAPAVQNFMVLSLMNKAKKSKCLEWRIRCKRLSMSENLVSKKLNMLESFMESAPQLVLQLYIMFEKDKKSARPDASILSTLSDLGRYFSISVSAFSLTSGIFNYDKRFFSYFYPAEVPLYVLGLLFIGRACFIISRVMILVLFATQFHAQVFTAGTFLWIATFAWFLGTEKSLRFWSTKRHHVIKIPNFWAKVLPDRGAVSFMWIWLGHLSHCHISKFSPETFTIPSAKFFISFITLIGNGIMIVLCTTQTSVGPHYVIAIIPLMLFSLGLIMINLYEKLYVDRDADRETAVHGNDNQASNGELEATKNSEEHEESAEVDKEASNKERSCRRFFKLITPFYVEGSLFIGRACFIISRILILALFAIQFHAHAFTFCTLHWVAMFAWILAIEATLNDSGTPGHWVGKLPKQGALSLHFDFLSRFIFLTFQPKNLL